MPDVTPIEQELRPTPSFKEVLLQSAFSRGRAIPDSVSQIDLGIFGNEGRELVQRTMEDSRRREFGKRVYITKDRKVLLQDKPTIGDEKSVFDDVKIIMTIDDVKLPWFLRQDKICATGIHSHPFEVPPGSHDLEPLLWGDFDRFAAVAVFVATPGKNFVIFRSQRTPQFTREQAREKIVLWEKQMKDRVIQFTNPNMPEEEQMEVNNRARGVLLRQIAEKYKLRIFSGDAKSTRAKLLF